MPGSIPRVNAPLQQAINTATAGALVERDGNGDSEFAHVVGKTALNAAGNAGGIFLGILAAKTTNYSPAETDFFVPFDCTSGALQANLPAAASNSGKLLAIQKTDSS